MQEIGEDYPVQAEDSQTIELPPTQQVPFLQSSQTVRRRCLSHEGPLPGEWPKRTRPKITLDIDKLLESQEYRDHLGGEDVDKNLGLQKSQTVSRNDNGTPSGKGKGLSTRGLPKPSELVTRSRKRTHKQRQVVRQHAVAVEEHVTQLQRKKAHFYGGVVQESTQQYVPHETSVQVTRNLLQQVPGSAEVVQHPSFTPSFWTDDASAQQIQHSNGTEFLWCNDASTSVRQHPVVAPSFWSMNDWLCGPSSSKRKMDEVPGLPYSNERRFVEQAPRYHPSRGEHQKAKQETARDLYFFTPEMAHLRRYPEE